MNEDKLIPNDSAPNEYTSLKFDQNAKISFVFDMLCVKHWLFWPTDSGLKDLNQLVTYTPGTNLTFIAKSHTVLP